jgi:hypothetical protein
VVAELPADAGAVELILQVPDEAAAQVDVLGGWVVGLPGVVADLAHAGPSWAPA